ncbi:efflux RND transporter periplasmic adaptor subunit [Candidatus Colwellia aromaticivorans]|uniref:efflux RND transporter periplasmic adaptor subunit n=1 Tax=Candidatus Colwellia aromaticivorans TaxID=2267621 RepID=UPI000DF19686|nr:efflux RND transporter periplasmic adaptor subunit [Candidatus Colwellia aromaticivorans]
MFTQKARSCYKFPLTLFFSLILVSGCSEVVEIKSLPEPIKAIKYIQINPEISFLERKLSGYIKAVKRSDLSFQISGQLLTLNVEEGDHVELNQPLAALDPTPYKFRVQQAQAELASANAQLKKSKENYSRQKSVYEKKIINKNTMASALAEYEQAESAVLLSESKLSMAQRDLTNTVLKAPFSGMITRRDYQSFEEISARQPVLEIQGQQDFEVAFLVPSNLIGRITQGSNINVRIPVLGESKQQALVTKLGFKADVRGAFPVSATIVSPDKNIKPGMVADVFIDVSHKNKVILVPESAVIIAANNEEQIFVFDSNSKQVHAKTVKTEVVDINTLKVIAGLSAGDIICVAGAEFLRNGQVVSLYLSPQDRH